MLKIDSNSFLKKIFSTTNSLYTQLLMVVIPIYILLVIILSAIQMISEFNHEKTKVQEELKHIAKSFTPGFSYALWEINNLQIDSLSKGALEQSVITGIKVFNNKKEILKELGQYDKNWIPKNQELEINKILFSEENELFSIALKLNWLRDTTPFDVGYMVLYSSQEVVWERVEFGFFLILLSALAQIVLFSLIFKFIFNQMLKKPLTSLTNTTKKTNLDNLQEIQQSDEIYLNNELKIFEESLKNMVEKLLNEQKIRQKMFENQQQVLEDEVEKRTQKIKHNEALYKTTIESVNNGILVVDENSHITHSNKRFRQMWKIPDKLYNLKNDEKLIEYVGEQLLDPKVFISKIEELYQSEDQSLDLIEFKDGRIFERFSQAMFQDNKIIGRVWSFDDITTRMNTQKNLKEEIEERKKIQQAMIKSENQLKMVMDNTPAIISYVDTKTLKYLLVNQKFCEQYDLKKEQIVGQHIQNIIGIDNCEFAMPYIEKAKKGNSITYINTFNLAQGIKWFNVHYVPDFDEKGEVRALFVMSLDITDRMQTQEELNNAKNEAEKANKAKSEFIANMSHEIRTPLNAVIGFSELLEKTKITDKQQSYLQSIQTGGKTLLNLINDILDLSKIEAGKMSIEIEPVNLRDLMYEIRQIFDFKLKEKDIDFQIHLDEKLPEYLMLDATRLRQILFNLVGNAIKFTHKGNIQINIKIKELKKNTLKELLIEVKDTGIGIAKDEQEKVFQSFEQQKGQNNKEYEGSGLGLSISKKLVELMHGKISLKSKKNKGSSFSIFLYDLKVSQDKPIFDSNKYINSNLLFKDQCILVVDDVESNRKLVKNLLENMGLKIIEAVDGLRAIDRAKEHKPNLILMDIRMPNMNGLEATKKLRKNIDFKNTPIIALTTKNQDKKYYKIFDTILEKPITQIELINELKKHLKYSLIEDKKEKTHAENLSEELFKTTIDEKIKELLSKAKESGEFDDINNFAKILQEFGKKQNSKPIIEYAKMIKKAVKNFDVKNIQELLKVFEK